MELWCDRQELRRWARHPEDEVDDSDEWDDGSSGSSESEDFDMECDRAVNNDGSVLQPNSPMSKGSSSGGVAGSDVNGGQQVTHSYNRKRKRQSGSLYDTSRSSSSGICRHSYSGFDRQSVWASSEPGV